jgi:hypothetical protein
MELFLDGTCRHEAVNITKQVMIFCCLTFKYIDFCLPVDIINDNSIICLDDVSCDSIFGRFEYRYMHGLLWNESNC